MTAPYQYTPSGMIFRRIDGYTIPVNLQNTDYQRYLLDTAGGALTDPADPPPVLKHDIGRFEGDAHTSGAVSSEMFRKTLPTLSQFTVTMTASGIALDNGAQRTLWVVSVVQRLNGGAIVLGQTVFGNIASATGSPVAAGAFVLAASGNDIVITVTGLASREIDWVLTGEYVRVRPSGF